MAAARPARREPRSHVVLVPQWWPGPCPSALSVALELGALLPRAGADPRLFLARPLAVTLRLPSWVTGPPYWQGPGDPAPRALVMLPPAVTFTRLHLTFC